MKKIGSQLLRRKKESGSEFDDREKEHKNKGKNKDNHLWQHKQQESES